MTVAGTTTWPLFGEMHPKANGSLQEEWKKMENMEGNT